MVTECCPAGSCRAGPALRLLRERWPRGQPGPELPVRPRPQRGMAALQSLRAWGGLADSSRLSPHPPSPRPGTASASLGAAGRGGPCRPHRALCTGSERNVQEGPRGSRESRRSAVAGPGPRGGWCWPAERLRRVVSTGLPPGPRGSLVSSGPRSGRPARLPCPPQAHRQLHPCSPSRVPGVHGGPHSTGVQLVSSSFFPKERRAGPVRSYRGSPPPRCFTGV